MHALLALASNPASTRADAVRVDAAYYPAISGLSTLLDSLADYDTDDPATDHRYVGYYPTLVVAANRLGEVAAAGATAARCLPEGSRHAVIVAGVTCFYLADHEMLRHNKLIQPILTDIGPIARPITLVLNNRRILHGSRQTDGKERW